MFKGKKRILIAALVAVSLILAALSVSAYQCSTQIELTQYTLGADVTEEIRLVQLTDLHGKVFAEDNNLLAALVAAQEPDLIVMTGDMMDKSDANADTVCRLIEKLTAVAPVYYGYGNHEYSWMKSHQTSLTPALTQAGAAVLDADYLDITVCGQELRLGGYYGYYRAPHLTNDSKIQEKAEMAFAADFEDTDRFKILLCHIPTAWLDWGHIDSYPVELVLSGHYHGGQIRLPLIGGLYAPYVGAFPEYTRGLYEGEQAVCVLSSGLGSSPGIPRINNLPEIVVVDLIPEG